MEINFYGITKKTNQFEMVKIFEILLNDAAKNNFNKFNITEKRALMVIIIRMHNITSFKDVNDLLINNFKECIMYICKELDAITPGAKKFLSNKELENLF